MLARPRFPAALRRAAFAAAMLAVAGASHPAASASKDDDTVIESFTVSSGATAAQRDLRRQLAARPDDPAAASRFARHQLALSRAQGDPRPAGQALAALQPWSDPRTAPLPVLLVRADLQQHLHDFDGARASLEQLLRRDPRQPQAWLTLATLHRLQGRYAAAVDACRRVLDAGAAFHGQACLAETQGLQGQVDAARRALTRLQASAADDGQRAWVCTTLAELEARNSRPAAAQVAYQCALSLSADGYARISFADFLLDQGRAGEVAAVLRDQPRSDSVLLRMAMAAAKTKSPSLARDRDELASRLALPAGSEREQAGHAREQGLWALGVQGDARKALSFARLNLGLQREPLDLLLMARAARAAGDAQALAELARIKKDMGLHDERLDALL